MNNPQTPESWEFPTRDVLLWVVCGFVILPFIYLTSLALLVSAYVHGYSVPSVAL